MRQVYGLVLVVFLVGWTSSNASAAEAEVRSKPASDVLHLAIASDSVSSRMTAIGFSSLVKLRKLGFEIDTVWARSGDDVLRRLASGEADLAILDLDTTAAKTLGDRRSLRAVMKYWTNEEAEAADPGAGQGEYVLVADDKVPVDHVDAFLDVALQDQITLRTVQIDVTRLTPETALTGFPLAAHEGVLTYLRRQSVEPQTEPDVAPVISEIAERAEWLPKSRPDVTKFDAVAAALDEGEMSKPGRSFTLYFDTADASIDGPGFQSVAEACRFAATLPSARFVISGHTDTAGSDTYNDVLSSRRASAVADAIRNDPRFREALSVVEFGEQRLAVDTGDGVPEPKNRRVEIAVIEE